MPFDGEFVMPEIWIGCPVEVSVGRSRGPYSLGMVLRKKTRSADVVVFGEGALGMMFDCWHDDDPRIDQSNNDAWEDNTRGTWHLTQGEIERRRMMGELVRVVAEVPRLTRRLEALEETRAKVAEPVAEPTFRPAPADVIKPRPARGRPRRVPIPLDQIRPLGRPGPLPTVMETVADE